MKRFWAVPVLTVLAALVLTACGLFHTNVTPGPESGGDYSYQYATEGPSSAPVQTQPTSPAVTLPTQVPTLPGAPTTLPAPSDTAPFVPSSELATGEPSTAEPTAAPEKPIEVVTDEDGSVELPVSLPAPNGTMVVSTDPGHHLIRAVSEARGVNVNLLAAVYSVPESGQNYVFEFTSASGRTVDDLRRVYLLDGNDKITSVAASSADERENVSATENWFCLNVLIKKMIFPKIEGELKG